jgi:carbon-monoxide dehydrogenase medium subunit
MSPFEYLPVDTVRKALRLLEKYDGEASVLAGGTDLVVKMRKGALTPKALVDVKPIEALRGIRAVGKSKVVIGPLTTLKNVADSELLASRAGVLCTAARSIGSPQIRNRATVGGNLANGSPASDMAPPLLVLDARVKIHSLAGNRTLPLSDFFVSPGETVLGRRDILGPLELTLPKSTTRTSYHTLVPRQAMDIVVVSAAALVRKYKGKVVEARLALGSVAPVPLRARDAEEALLGTSGDAQALSAAVEAAVRAASPIADVRSSLPYRRDMIEVVVRRALSEVLS